MRLLLFLAVSLVCLKVYALDVVSEHNEEHAAIKEAQRLLVEDGCAPAYPDRKLRYRLVREGDDIRILAKEFSLTCIRDPTPTQSVPTPCECESPSGAVEIVWGMPGNRANGDELNPEDISHYWVYYGQSETALTRLGKTENLNFISEELPPGNYVFAITTVDSTGLESGYSDLLKVAVD